MIRDRRPGPVLRAEPLAVRDGLWLRDSLTLFPTYIDLFDPSGLMTGLFTTGLTVTVMPLARGGDRFAGAW